VFLLYLLPYSSDFNPIEKTGANKKKDLRSSAPLHGLIESSLYAYLSCYFSGRSPIPLRKNSMTPSLIKSTTGPAKF
jgi:transposase